MLSDTSRFSRQLLHCPARFALIITQRQQRIQNVVAERLAVLRPGSSKAAAAPGQLVAQFQQQTLGGLLADAGNLDQPAHFLSSDDMGQLSDRHAAQDSQCQLRPDATDFEQLPESSALVVGGEAIQLMRILAHDQLGVQRDFFADGGKIVEGAHRHVDFITDARPVHQHQRGVLFQQGTAEFCLSFHQSSILHPETGGCQLAQPLSAMGVADGASQCVRRIGLGIALKLQQAPHHILHLFLWPHGRCRPRPASPAGRCIPPPANPSELRRRSRRRAPAPAAGWIGD